MTITVLVLVQESKNSRTRLVPVDDSPDLVSTCDDNQMLYHEPTCVDPVALVCIYASVRICCSLACSEQGVSAGVLLVKDCHE